MRLPIRLLAGRPVLAYGSAKYARSAAAWRLRPRNPGTGENTERSGNTEPQRFLGPLERLLGPSW
eukprot:8963886-Pyramimonas_sp.AAC.1